MRNDLINRRLKLRPNKNEETTISGEGRLQWWRTNARWLADAQTLNERKTATPIKSHRWESDTTHWLTSWLTLASLFISLALRTKVSQPISNRQEPQTLQTWQNQTSSANKLVPLHSLLRKNVYFKLTHQHKDAVFKKNHWKHQSCLWKCPYRNKKSNHVWCNQTRS